MAATAKYVREFKSEMGLLDANVPSRVSFVPTKWPHRRVIKWGQMKLLLGEIQWLTNHWNQREMPEIILVVAGGAPGHHYRPLLKLFPGIKRLDLWDTSNFAEGLAESDIRINIIPKRMYVEDARLKYSALKNVFFVSDIRTIETDMSRPDGTLYTIKEVEEGIWGDHELQRDLLEVIEPVSSLLKFRLPRYMPNSPWQPTQKTYLSGHIYIQPFIGELSRETRLVPKKGPVSWETCLYSMRLYAEKLFYVNSVLRNDIEIKDADGNDVFTVWRSSINDSTDIPDGDDLQNSFDAAYTLDILDRYILSTANEEIIQSTQRFLTAMCLWNWCRDEINALMKNKFIIAFQRGIISNQDQEDESDLNETEKSENLVSQDSEPDVFGN